MSFTFCSSYFNLTKESNDINFNKFDKLVKTNFQIILFLDTMLEYKVKEYEQYSNLKIILTKWEDLHLNNSDISKELILSNSQSYFLKLAKKLTSTNTIIYIDFNILGYIDNVETFQKYFSKFKNHNKILIPGGNMSSKLLKDDELFQTKSKRFLSGLLICPTNLINRFDEYYMKEVKMTLKENKLCYDVNYLTNIEHKTSNLIHYYRTGYSSTMFNFYDKKVILNSMIKNEEKIIRRCIDSVKSLCDAFCISDTMSTDNTVNIVKEYINEHDNIPGKIYQNPWSDFGANRTISYNNSVAFCKELGWDPENTWGLLLDADMKLIVLPQFNKQDLYHDGYTIIQSNNMIDYHNTRFIKLNGMWKCVGYTHEYWTGGNDTQPIVKSSIYIDDIGDGGCKDDKFERDIRLLTKGIKAEPTNARYHFYLAQTLHDTQKYKESIDMYKRRIKLGGWIEETWYSYYRIAQCWLELKDIHKTELWANKAYDLRPSRVEPIYLLVKLFREKGQHFKAYHYYMIGKQIPPSTDSLFVEKNISNFLLDYEYTIIQYYIFNNERLDGLKHCVKYINNSDYNDTMVYSNMVFYVESISKLGVVEKQDKQELIPNTSLKYKDTELFINNWYPLQLGTLKDLMSFNLAEKLCFSGTNNNNVIIKYDTPKIFKYYNKATILCEYNNMLWCLTSCEDNKFYQFIILDKETYKPISYTLPFHINNTDNICKNIVINDNIISIYFIENEELYKLNISIDKISKLICIIKYDN